MDQQLKYTQNSRSNTHLTATILTIIDHKILHNQIWKTKITKNKHLGYQGRTVHKM